MIANVMHDALRGHVRDAFAWNKQILDHGSPSTGTEVAAMSTQKQDGLPAGPRAVLKLAEAL